MKLTEYSLVMPYSIRHLSYRPYIELIEVEMHIYFSKLIIIGSDNGLALTNDVIFLIGPLGTNFNEILIEINTF